LDELKIGEQLQTLGKKEQKWTRFYTWGDVEREFAAEFIRFKFGQENDGLELTMTAEHMLFVADIDGKNKIVKKAGQVCIGKKKCMIFDEKLQMFNVFRRQTVSSICLWRHGIIADCRNWFG
jgi:hypothetical protein